MKTLKTIFIILAIIAVLLFSAGKIYKLYSRNNINAHESVVLINDNFSEHEIEVFFNLKKGTYDSKKHKLVYSLIKKDAYLLDTYINLPTKYKFSPANNQFDCDAKYADLRPYAFYDYEIDNNIIIARIIANDASFIKKLNSKLVVAEKQLSLDFEYGKINIYDIGSNGFTKHCK